METTPAETTPADNPNIPDNLKGKTLEELAAMYTQVHNAQRQAFQTPNEYTHPKSFLTAEEVTKFGGDEKVNLIHNELKAVAADTGLGDAPYQKYFKKKAEGYFDNKTKAYDENVTRVFGSKEALEKARADYKTFTGKDATDDITLDAIKAVADIAGTAKATAKVDVDIPKVNHKEGNTDGVIETGAGDIQIVYDGKRNTVPDNQEDFTTHYFKELSKAQTQEEKANCVVFTIESAKSGTVNRIYFAVLFCRPLRLPRKRKVTAKGDGKFFRMIIIKIL